MQIKQFEDKNLSHYSYAILSESENRIILVDPSRDPSAYLDYAKKNNAVIAGVIETHPHADFTSSHLELHETQGATIYASKLAEATYPHESFDEGQAIQLGEIKLHCLNTPGHSPDSICVVLEHEGKQKAVFTGDTLFIGDCGRPDLRAGDQDAKMMATRLAGQMYHTLRKKLAVLPDDVIVYPAHGAGTLCGKSLGKESESTIGKEKQQNWSLQPQTEEAFVQDLLREQPFIPAYFPYDVKLNKAGVPGFRESVSMVAIGSSVADLKSAGRLDENTWIIDSRDAVSYKKGHLLHSINLMLENKFETWLGSIIKPAEPVYFTAGTEADLLEMIKRAAAIGYEGQIKEAFVMAYDEMEQEPLDLANFRKQPGAYTIVDVRNTGEAAKQKIFSSAMQIPLGELRDRLSEIPRDKPIVVHCASGYRSAAGSSLLQSAFHPSAKVFDLGEAVKDFIK